jgi:phosphate:Na+ symporter
VYVEIVGGIGLFLLGMTLLTDGLRALAGDALRRMLARFTGGPLKATASGALLTALVQSSSATTLATLGLVSAGLLTLPQAIGVVLGANVGTTSTAWLVSLVGLKFSVSALALPLVAAGALWRIVSSGRGGVAGLALAGFGLLFVGIDILQAGMAELAAGVTLEPTLGDTFPGMLVATTLAALHAGAIDLPQAAVLVIGQNVGTTVTALLAAMGASVPARRTALAHVVFNVATGVVAFAALPLLVPGASAVASLTRADAATVALAAFHTAFNVLGVLLFLPWVAGFAALLVRLVPDRGPALTRHLDPSVATVPAVAIEAARRTIMDLAIEAVELARQRPRSWRDGRDGEERRERAEEAVRAARAFLAQVRTTPGTTEGARHVAALHALDHVDRLLDACSEHAPRRTLATAEDARLLRKRLDAGLAASLAAMRGVGAAPQDALQLLGDVGAARVEERSRVLELAAQGQVTHEEASLLLDAFNWADRFAQHLGRALHHLQPPTGAGRGT